MRVIQAPTRAVRSRGWRVCPLSVGRARPGPGPCGRSGGASSPGPVLTASGGRRCASPRGPAQGCSSARAAPRGALSARARSPAAAAPLAGPSCSLSLLLALARPPARGSQPPGPPGDGRGSSPPGLHAPAAAPAPRRAHRPPQVAKRGGENAPAPPPPSPGCGGRGSWRAAAAAAAAAGGGGSDAVPGASAPRNNRSGWRRADVGTARSTVHRACELSSCSRGGARRALTRPWPLAARRGSRGSASRRLARAGASPRLASGPGAARRVPQAAGPALHLPRLEHAAFPRSRRPGRPARCSAPARLTGASAGSGRGVSPPARPLRFCPISGGREAVTRVTRRRILRGAGPGAATRAFRGKIQRPAGRLSNLLPQAGARRDRPSEDCNSRHAGRRRRAEGPRLEAQSMLVFVVPLSGPRGGKTSILY